MINIMSVFKSFVGKSVLEDISLNIEGGQVYCIIGKNGVGKTTLFNLILNLIKPDKGSIQIFNKQHNELDIKDKRRIGVLREDLSLINELTGYDYLKLTGHFYKISEISIDHKITELLSLLLDEKENVLKNIINTYSYGTKKKIALIGALLNEPDILILDEPFNGLDPVSSKKFISYITQYRKDGRIILLSSHNLNYIRQIATHIGILHQRRLIFNSLIKDFPIREGEQIEDTFYRMVESNSMA